MGPVINCRFINRNNRCLKRSYRTPLLNKIKHKQCVELRVDTICSIKMIHERPMHTYVYLGGAINGCTDSECNDWRTLAIRLLSKDPSIAVINPMDRDYRGVEDEKYIEIVESDKTDIDNSDILLVSYDKPSVGTSMEILYAYEHNTTMPIYLFTRATTISPWLRYHVDIIFDSLESAVDHILA